MASAPQLLLCPVHLIASAPFAGRSTVRSQPEPGHTVLTEPFISRNGRTYLLSLKRPSCFTLGTRQETLSEYVSFLQDAECETFNQVFRGKATSGSSYPDVINHCGQRLPDCCPGDEYRTRSSIWARLSGQTGWETLTTVLWPSLKGTSGPRFLHLQGQRVLTTQNPVSRLNSPWSNFFTLGACPHSLTSGSSSLLVSCFSFC